MIGNLKGMMNFFRKSRETEGWRAVFFAEDEVRACHVRRPASGKPVVMMAVSEPMNGGTDIEALARLAKDWQGAPHAYTTSLNSANYQFLPVDAPNVPAAELKAAISWTITDMIDFRNEEATIDVLNIPFPKDSPQRARSMYAIVTRTELANEVHRRFQGARLPLKVIDVPEMAQRNIAALVEPDGRAVALVSCDASGSLLTITSNGELFLARRISVSLPQLRVDDASRRMEYQEQVALEIQRSIDHFHRQFAWLGVAKLLVAPMGDSDSDSDSGMVAALSDNLDIDVEPLKLEEVLDLSQVPELGMAEAQNKYFMALGLALRQEETTL